MARQMYSASSVALIILIHCYGISSIQEAGEEEDTLHRHTGLKFKGEKTSTLLHWEKSFVWC